jgi:hypothetical protein
MLQKIAILFLPSLYRHFFITHCDSLLLGQGDCPEIMAAEAVNHFSFGGRDQWT